MLPVSLFFFVLCTLCCQFLCFSSSCVPYGASFSVFLRLVYPMVPVSLDFLRLVYPMVPVSLDCLRLVYPMVPVSLDCLRLVYPMVPVSLDSPFLIAPSMFSNVYFDISVVINCKVICILL
jgi:hypothetical protein